MGQALVPLINIVINMIRYFLAFNKSQKITSLVQYTFIQPLHFNTALIIFVANGAEKITPFY